MRRQTRCRSQSISVFNNGPPENGVVAAGSPSPTNRLRTTRCPSVSSAYIYDTRSESPNGYQSYNSNSLQQQSLSLCSEENDGSRRESLVKPTWQNVRPGQIPLKQLEKINGIISESDTEDSNADAVQQTRRRTSVKQSIASSSASAAGSVGAAVSSSTGGAIRKHSSGNLGQLTRKGSLVVHRDSLSHSSPTRSRQSTLRDEDNTEYVVDAEEAAHKRDSVSSSSGGKSSRRSIVRLLSQRCTTAQGSDEEMDYDFMAKVRKTVVLIVVIIGCNVVIVFVCV